MRRIGRNIGRVFVIETRIEAFVVIYALALGATARGAHYLGEYPGWPGKLLFLAATGSVFLAGAEILDCVRYERAFVEQEWAEREHAERE